MTGHFVGSHWSIESMHRRLDVNLLKDSIRRKSSIVARNLNIIQKIIFSVFSILKGLRKKRSDKRKGVAELMKHFHESYRTHTTPVPKMKR